MIRKLFITPWFGDYPEWMNVYWSNVEKQLKPYGYDFLLYNDLEEFKQRVRSKLDIHCPIEKGTGKIHDYRAAFAVIFSEEIKGYDFWGHTDFDMVYGRVNEWVTDDLLTNLDIHSNHIDYISGPWTLYRNTSVVNSLFLDHHDWVGNLENPATTGWVEKGFTELVDTNHEMGNIKRLYTMWQTQNLNDFSSLHWDGDKLMEGANEVMYAHFRRTKEYPRRCL